MTVQVNNDEKRLRAFMEQTEARLKALEASPGVVRHDFGNLVTNGTFDADTDWSKGAGVTISGGVVNATAATDIVTQESTLVIGRNYIAAFDYTETTSIRLRLRQGQNIYQSGTIGGTGSGTISLPFIATASGDAVDIEADGTGFTGTIDNLSIYETDPADGVPWLRLPRGFRVGQHGIIVRDGTDLLMPGDYTEISRGDQHFIKPIVAPGAATEFAVWAYRG